MTIVELSVHVAQGQLIVALNGDRFVPQPLDVPSAWITAIAADVARLETLVRTWSAREQVRFHALKRGIGLALAGLLLGRPALLDALESPPPDRPDLQPTVLDRELTVALRHTGPQLIRLLLGFDDPDWAALPWELMLWPDHGEVPLATDPRVSLVRRAVAADPGIRPVAPGTPRVLATVSDPASFGLATPLAPTWKRIEGHLATHLGERAEVVTAAAEDLDAVLDRVSGISVIVALAHGTARLRIMLPRDRLGGGPPFFEVDAQQFRARFTAGGAPRLAILIMCYSAGGEDDEDRQSAAEALIAGGCAAVVAMHGTVYLPAAEVFVDTLCTHLAAGQPIDVGVQRARAALARFGQAHAHAESPDHAFRPRLLVRQSADLAPVFPQRRRPAWWGWIGAAIAALLLIGVVVGLWPEPSVPVAATVPSTPQSTPHIPLVEVPRTTVAGLPSRYQPQAVRPFRISPVRVSQAQWVAVMGHNPSWKGPQRGGQAALPVERVAYHAVFEFMNRLSIASDLPACYVLEGCDGAHSAGCPQDASGCVGDAYTCRTARLRPDCTGYRLPTWSELNAALLGDAPLPERASQRAIDARFYQVEPLLDRAVGSGPTNALGVGDFDDRRYELVTPTRAKEHLRCGCAELEADRCGAVSCVADPDPSYRSVRVSFRVARTL